MTGFVRVSQAAIIVATAFVLAGPACAQDRPNFIDNLFGNNNAQPPAGGRGGGGVDEADLAVQVNDLRERLRQLTGQLEQMQYRNQQLEQQVRSMGGNPVGSGPASAPGANMGSGGYPANQQPAPRGMQQDYPQQRGMQQQPDYQQRGAQQDYPPRGMQQQSQQDYPPRGVQQDYPPRGVAQQPVEDYPPAVIAASPSGRSDVFDPSQNPNAPGAPRPLGSPNSASQPVGAPYGRAAGAPLDLSSPGNNRMQEDQSALPPPAPRNPNATGTQMASVQPAAPQTPRDAFDLANGHVKRKDYALAEDSLRDFLKKYPNDARVGDVHYWLGESLYQRQKYADAADSFLKVVTKYQKNTKAPESLLRLGQSLAAIGEKKTACDAWAEIGIKYANAPDNVKKTVASEQKRVRCQS